MKQIVFIVPQLSQPRCIKRITAIYNTGIPCKVFGFDNGLYSENIKNFPILVDGIFQNKKKTTIARYFYPDLEVWRLVRKYRKDSVFYLFSAEIAAKACKLFGAKEYIYEEADISSINNKSAISRWFWSVVDKSVIKKSLFTVFTSSGFIRHYFGSHRPDNIILLPNKLHPSFGNNNRKDVTVRQIDVGHIRFGFIGSIRYPNTIVRFARVVGEDYPQHEFHFYGNVNNNPFLDDDLKCLHNIFFHGSFSNPQDLSTIYANIDINIVCYDPAYRNVLIAEPNKLYESAYFLKPIVVSQGTFLEERVMEWGTGFAIDATSEESIRSFIDSISIADIRVIIDNAKRISSADLVDDESELIKKLNSLV